MRVSRTCACACGARKPSTSRQRHSIRMGSAGASIFEILRNANSSVSILRCCGNAPRCQWQPSTIVRPSQIGTPRHWQPCWRRDSLEPARSSSESRRVCARRATSAGNLDNRHVEIVCAASAPVNVSVLYQFVDTANRPASPRGGAFPGRAARGPVAPRKMACRPAAREGCISGSRPSTRAREGQRRGCPLSNRSGNGRQDARPCFASRPVIHLHRRRLDLGYVILGSVFFALGGVAAIGLAENHWR
jgi:hypothetical protein